MKIIRLGISQFKLIEAALIEMREGKSVVIGGKNRSGKSAALDAVKSFLAGPRHTCVRPIKEGESESVINVEFDNGLEGRQRLTIGGRSLDLTDARGKPVPEPRTFLQKLTGGMAFDLSDFVGTDSKERMQTVADLAGLDFSDGEAKTKELVEERKLLGREARKLEAQLQGSTEWKNTPAEEISVGALLAKLKEAEAKNQAHGNLQAELIVKQARTVEIHTQMALLQDEKDRLTEELKEGDARLEKMVVLDTAPISAELDSAEETNRHVRENAQTKTLRDELRDRKQRHADADNEIKDIARLREKSIRDADMPIEGLSFSNDGVLFEGIPYEQCSEEEKYTVALAIGIRLVPKDGIRVFLMRTGGVLDLDSLRDMLKLAESEDAQLIVEVPRENDVDVIFRDGAIVEEAKEDPDE
jgi:hypothetical protein